jgi:glycosyltransferase involved in cell wall biosynthesis
VPEIIKNGRSGFIVQNIREAVEAVKEIPRLSRNHCRSLFEKRFTAKRMAEDYVAVYQDLIQAKNMAPHYERHH